VKRKIKVHLWTLPRWFAAPIFGASAVLGGLLAGGMTLNSWLGVVGCLLIMAGGHSFNSFLDYAWTGLDKGGPEERSAEKDYTGGQSVIAAGIVSVREVALNAISWYVLALAPLIYLALNVGWPIIVVGLLGMLVTFGYAQGKFNWTHELMLGLGAGPLAVLGGMFATTASPPWVWENGVSLEWYLSSWLLFMYLYQVLLIAAGLLVPLSAISFFTWPLLMSFLVLLKQNFRKWAGIIVLTGVTYPLLLALGQFIGS
jgi:1,4-dihydroxy-2-naphthoate octaprenyltransferase